MIDTEKAVITALEDADIVGDKVFRWGVHSDYADDYPYIRVTELDNTDKDYRDNKATSANIDIQVDFWTLDDPAEIQNKINQVMVSLGYVRKLVTPVFERETGAIRKTMRYRIKTELKGDA